MNIRSTPVAADLPPELRLLAACCAHPVTGESRRQVEDLADRIGDWDEVSKAAQRHQVQGFVQNRLSGCEAVPDEIRNRWANEARNRATFNLRQAGMTGKLHKLLNEHSIRNLVIKGLPLAAHVYGSLSIKRSADIDLLIEPQNAVRAVDLLARNGFVALETGEPLTASQTESVVRHFKEITLVGDGNILIDLHWRLVEQSNLLRGIEPFANARAISIENIGSISVLGEEDEFAYLCTHGALSDWSRLKWLADVNAVIAERGDKEILALYEYAKGLGAGPSVLQALALRALLWGTPLPQELAQQFQSISDDHFVAYPIARMTMPYKPESSRDALRRIASQSRIRSTLYGSRAAAIRELTSHLRALPDVLALPLPASLDWLYLPLRPVMWLDRKLRS
ncbi:nucleotidyltransferase family protein [Erythrobacter sp. THAF29]|uniref:nucleotidyltransferase family protein n=1 Tax=Erythrobacter sp. THAF29 TaxID=2587851 RepID=UPI0012689E62|nr:nucleotidyltransferase family protein [Erythrobacter sp. THAF29]QFT78481.1 hypothetical protein FIU90_13095 [Erythrobacter sp. THAF29]